MSEKHSYRPELDEAEVWVFDLDNTLYPARCNLFAQVDERMGRFISDLLGVDRTEARAVQKRYFREYGTTLSGLMQNHGLDPAEFLGFVHDIDYSPVDPDPVMEAALSALPGRKLIFTNGTVAHAEAVMDRLGVAHHFEAVFDIVASDYVPKPRPDPYHRLIDRHGIEPERAVMVEDIARNLEAPAALGMQTVWVRTDNDWGRDGADAGDHVHHVTDDLSAWLQEYVNRRGRAGTLA